MLFLACIVHSFWFAARSLLRFPGSAVVTNPPVKQETWVQFLGQKDPLEKEMTTHSNIVAWEIPWTEKPRGATVHVGHKELDKTEYD